MNCMEFVSEQSTSFKLLSSITPIYVRAASLKNVFVFKTPYGCEQLDICRPIVVGLSISLVFMFLSSYGWPRLFRLA